MSGADGSGLPAVRGVFAVPGDLQSPTGGYGYARQLLAHGRAAGLVLDHWPLPGGFPAPDTATLEETRRRLALAPAGWPVLIDGLALGVLPPETIRAAEGPVVALCHHPLALESGLSPARAAALMRSERAALGECAGVITTSEATAATLRRDFGVSPTRLAVARPGTVPAARAGRMPGETVRLLSVGALIPRKGHDVLIDALARLGDLDWSLTVVGPDDRDPACAAALTAQVAAAGLEARVSFAGAADAQALERHYAAADLFVLASRHEGFGMAFAEALAHGLAVVAPDLDAVREATLGAARLVPAEDPEALSHALAALIGQSLTRARLAAACARAGERLPRWADTAAAVAAALAGFAGQPVE